MTRLKTLATTALLSLATLTVSAQAQASTNWFSDLFDGISSLIQGIKNHDWDAEWDRDHKKDWDKEWEHDWDKQWSGKWRWDWDDLKKWGHGNGHNGKWFVCHRTGSSKNPYVIIEVSTSGKHAHLAHGDSIVFSDKGNGRCGASTPPDPKITNLSLASDEISVNTTTTLAWTSTNATSCKLDGTTLPASGTTNVGPYSSPGNRNLTLTCTGAGGSDSETIKLKVVKAAKPAPQVTLTLEPSQIAIGAKAKLSWNATDAKSCKLQGSGSLYAQSFSISIDDSGYYMKGPFPKPGQATYTVTCTGSGGTDSASVTLTVGSTTPPPAPTVTFSIAASEILVGGTTTATWSSANATSCSLGGGATSGTVTVGPYSTAGQQSLTVTCTGTGGTASQTVTVNVVDPTPAPTEQLCMTSDFVGNGLETWIVDYNLETGEFTGTASRAGEPALSGGVVPAAGVPIEEALYMPGTLIDVRAGSMLGLGNGLTFANGNAGADGYAQYQIDLYAQSAPSQAIGNTRLVVHGETFCTQLGGQTPAPR
ncbi:MAG: hypothetical protein SV422_08120 [Pseudomonadota bacterium]|nr:hypothetical protein [Pseudomonadota bacterium]